MAINNAMPLKTALCDTIANLKSFWGLATPTTVLARFPYYTTHS